MLLSKLKSIKAQKSNVSIIAPDNGWYLATDISRILQMEKARSRETGSEFILEVINFSSLLEKRHTFSGDDYHRFLQKMVDVISLNTRRYDVKYFMSLSKIGVFLMDCHTEGAKAYESRMTEKIQAYFREARHRRYEDFAGAVTLSTSRRYALSSYSSNSRHTLSINTIHRDNNAGSSRIVNL